MMAKIAPEHEFLQSQVYSPSIVLMWQVHMEILFREEDNLSEKVQQELLKISSEFCAWVKNLPGEDTEVNDLEPEAIWWADFVGVWLSSKG